MSYGRLQQKLNNRMSVNTRGDGFERRVVDGHRKLEAAGFSRFNREREIISRDPDYFEPIIAATSVNETLKRVRDAINQSMSRVG